MKHTLVAGSAHLDILARPREKSGYRDRIGSVQLAAGGTACNVAFNLRKLGRPVRLMTAWGTSPIDRMMASHIESLGVDLMVDEVSGMGIAAFAAQLTPEGDLESAVSAMCVDKHTFSPLRITQAVAGTDLIVVEANLNSETMHAIAKAGRDAGSPVFGMAVSEDKVERLIPALPLLTALFANGAECEALMEKMGAADPSDITESIGVTLIVTRGERGAVVYGADGSRVKIQPPTLQDMKTLLGVGDAFSVGIIDGVVRHGKSYAEAAEHAHDLVKEIACRDTCNALSLHTLSNMVDELDGTARYDALTGLMQRAAFEREYKRLEESGGHALLLIDCDRFKQVNDEHGHEVGDSVLKGVASIIAGSIRKGDIPGRWGGDEFVVVLPPSSDAQVVAERIRGATAASQLYGVTLSVGVAIAEAGEKLETVFRRADAAMYSAKRNGRDAVVFESETSRNAA
ncbi:PfkB family carbohydrate kinase [Paraburkholderia fungorum]|uniref:diguanylate cyclase n=1 Tax=Paraburkholderia fungorum TaxID=134537 RepID=A0AAW3V5P8_9BURK|nr:PfkB family carbohydrate kinase [Paraburkholderia fungorum]MBB6204511.1 diguanylate cyclase (GGDEF)-like protein [Paraburkholderia fungorum]